MSQYVRFIMVSALGALMVAGLPFAGMARATGTDCSDVGHRIAQTTYDAWFTPDEGDTSTARIDHLWDVDPTGPTSTLAGSPWTTPAGHIMRRWLHVCVPDTGHYDGVVRFRDPGDNPNWNDRFEAPVSALGRTDVVGGQFFQVVPNEGSDTFHLRPRSSTTTSRTSPVRSST